MTGRARGADVGQGLRRGPGHADRRPAWPCCGWTGCGRWSACTPGVEREDEMVAAFDYCLHGRGGAAPSIDTAMHGLVDAAHVDHLHPDSGIALATAADGEALTRACFGDRVVWVPWRRPGFQLGLDIAAVQRANPRRSGSILGGHGITAWGATSDECEARSLEIIATAQRYLDDPRPRRAVRAGDPRLRAAARGGAPGPGRGAGAGASAAWPPPTGRRSATSPTADVVLDFLARSKHPALAALGTSCPDHFLRTKVGPLVLDLPPSAPLAEVIARLARAARGLPRRTTAAYYERHADAGLARRCAAPTRPSCWCPASACSASARTSRPRGWPGSSTSTRST